jgi:DNA (cytosine-5)-methyltransferase 1
MIASGECYLLPKWVRRIREIGSGLWPTAGAQEGGPIPPDTNYRPNKWSYNNRTGKHVQITLRRFVQMWPTPQASDGRKWNNMTVAERKAKGQFVRLCNATEAGGQLNPTWVEWLMGYPSEWTDLKPLATQSFQEWLAKHGGY